MMNKYTFRIAFIATFFLFASLIGKGQVCEWRLVAGTYSAVDPDGAGPATGSATFTLQIHTTGGNITDVTVITTGFSYQSANAMVPTSVNCTLANSPSNIVVSPEFAAGGYTFSSVNQCNIFTQVAGPQTFDRTAAGTMDATGAGVTITPAWMDIYTVTLWTLGNSYPQAGYVMINSGAGGNPGELGSYAVADLFTNEYVANSLTFTTPLPLGAALPVLFSKFDAQCTNTGTLISWATAQESNSNRFEIEKSSNGINWTSIATVAAAGSSNAERNYQQLDLAGGSAFYRIKQIDQDGQAIYTSVERTSCQVKNIATLIYPVPAYDLLNVVIRSDRNIRTQLMVYDMQGKLVRKVDAAVQNGNNSFRVSLTGLASGDYMIRTNDSSIELNKIFTISR